ncbi:hypothetical protein [Terricaulis sp.]|uniref:hypothetical protein n=1 Tax=Terricaulis sp. TaxID=2768686 RepID=UPI003784FEB9
MHLALWAIGAAVAIVALDRLGLWAERRGYIYWRKTRRRGSAMSDILTGLDAITNPAAQHVTEAKQAKKLEERDNGDPPRA